MNTWVISGTRRGTNTFAAHIESIVQREGKPSLLFVGDATGIDTLALSWAMRNGVRSVVFCASYARWQKLRDSHIEAVLASSWQKYGAAAGPQRNETMILCATPAATLHAFPDELSVGTYGAIRFAKCQGNRCEVYPW